jgi:hypothetical protein
MYCRSLVVGVLLLAPVAAMSAKATSEAAQDSSPAVPDKALTSMLGQHSTHQTQPSTTTNHHRTFSSMMQAA